MVGDFLFEERIRSDRAALTKLAGEVAPLFSQADTDAMRGILESAAEELGGRLLALDRTGKIQLDTLDELAGRRFVSSEVASILSRGQSVAFGVHDGVTGERINTSAISFSLRPAGTWVSYCATQLADGDELSGALLLIAAVNDMMRGMYELQRQMLIIFLLVAVAVLVCSLVFSHVITRPITAVTRVIQRMAKGDFSARVKVTGSSEIRHMAQAFNLMSEKLETLDFSRNQFVSNASHELKTPLATMKIMIESLIYQPEMDKGLRTEFLTDIDKEIDRLTAIVSDLLTLVRMDSNSVRLTRENLSIAALVKETAHRLAPMAEKRRQIVQVTLSDPCDTYADRGKLTQVVYNLMDNAVKYTQPGGQIKVALQRVGRDAVLTVSDNGPGIPKEGLPHIFDRFYRVDKARSRETGGTGLGLSIVHQLVMLHGGSIRVDSEEGQGTTFTVELPLHEG